MERSYIVIAAAYGRTSKDRDDAFSVESQIDFILEYATRINITIPEEFIFKEDFSGAKYSRPELNKVLKLLREKRIDALIIYQPDRLARKVGIAEQILDDEIFANNAQLHVAYSNWIVRPTSDDYGRFYDEMVYAAKERLRIIERFQRGKKKKLTGSKELAPMWIGDHPIAKYGYRIVGEKRNTRIEKVDCEIMIVENIFEMFYELRLRVVEIVYKLNFAGVPTPSQMKNKHWFQRDTWNESMIYRILKDEAYTGRWYANKTKQVNGKQVKRDKKEWTPLEFPELRIIDDATFNNVKQLLAQGRTFTAPEPKYEYLMTRRMKCECKYAVCARTTKIKITATEKKEYSYYYCSGGRRGQHYNECDMPNVRSEYLDGLVWMELEHFLLNPEDRMNTLLQAQQELQARNQDTLEYVFAAQQRYEEYEQKLDRLYADLENGLITENIYKKRKEELDHKLQAASDVKAEYIEELPSKILSNSDIADIDRDCEDLARGLEEVGELDLKKRKELLDALGVTGIIKIENGKQVLHLFIYDAFIRELFLRDVSLSSPGKQHLPQILIAIIPLQKQK